MLIYIIEPYYTGSHKLWVDGLVAHSQNEFRIFTMKGRFWKWRMQGSAITISSEINKVDIIPDLIICTDYLDLACLKALIKFRDVPIILYMHENQLTYPLSKYSKNNYQELSFGYLNYKSCLCADFVIFNSHYHRKVFLDAAKALLHKMPDSNNIKTIKQIYEKSYIIPVGIEFNFDSLNKYFENEKINEKPTLLYNHRWEHDKRPDVFMNLLDDLIALNMDFQLNITNLNDDNTIRLIKSKFSDYINYIGFCDSRSKYMEVLAQSDILPVTSDHDFFGISVIEAIYMGCYPILPSDLCYKEHFFEIKEQYFYTNYDTLLKQTTEIITQFSECKTFQPDKIAMVDYSWSNVIEQYDLFFRKVQ